MTYTNNWNATYMIVYPMTDPNTANDMSVDPGTHLFNCDASVNPMVILNGNMVNRSLYKYWLSVRLDCFKYRMVT